MNEEGHSLEEALREATLSAERVARIGEALFLALASAHDAGIAHGNLTSRRVMLLPTPPGVKLIEFASSVASPSALSRDVIAAGEVLRAALGPGEIPIELSECIDACRAGLSSMTVRSARELAAQFAKAADALGADPLVDEDDSFAELVREVAGAPHVGAAAVARALAPNEHTPRLLALPADRFDVRRKLGRGGFGVVYEAFDRMRNEVVAVKTLEKFDGDRLYRFKKEFRALSTLRHQNLVRLYDLGHADGTWFFTMELVPGVDFVSFVRRSPSMLRPCLRQLVDGIAAVHASGRLHRDLKPQNVLVTTSGTVKILDFGLVAELSPDELQTAETAGTPAYMAPETLSRAPLTPGTDWYSFGAMLYEALIGQVPFSGTNDGFIIEKLRSEPPPPRTLRSDVPPDLDALATALLSRHPGRRPPLVDICAVTHATEVPAHAVETRDAFVGDAPDATDVFVGREPELAAMRAALVESRAAPVVVVIEGESGIGKTALARRFLREVKEAASATGGAIILSGRCYERESVPFNAFDGVVDSLTRTLCSLPTAEAATFFPRRRDAPCLARLFPVLERVPSWPMTASDNASPLELRTRAFSAVRELLSRLAEALPVIVFIDDAQWADADSLALLEVLLEPSTSPLNVFILCTSRAGVGPFASSSDHRAAWRQRVKRISLGGLDRDDVGALAVACGVSADVDDIAREAHGHPLFVHELLLRRTAAVEAMDESLDDVLWRRIRQLPGQQRALLDVAAIAGAPLPLRVLTAAAQATHGAALNDIDALRAVRLLRTGYANDIVEPYHDRIRDIVVRRADDAVRLHTQLADVLARDEAALDDPQLLVRHLEAAGDYAGAALHAERAAERATSALAFDRAASLLETALRLGTPTAEAARALHARRAAALANAGRGADAAAAYLASSVGAEPHERLPSLARAAVHLIGSGHRERGNEVLREVLAAFGEPWPTSRGGALLHYLWERFRLKLRGLRFSLRPRWQIDARTLLRLEVNDDLCYVVAATDLVHTRALYMRACREALESGDEKAVARALAREAVVETINDPARRDEGLALLERAKGIISEPDAELRALFHLQLGTIHFSTGFPAAAARELAIAETVFRDETMGETWQLDFLRRVRLMSHRACGALGELVRCYDGYLADVIRRGDLLGEFSFSSLFAIRFLASDDVKAARATVARAKELAHVQAIGEQKFIALVNAVDIDLYAGETATTFDRLGDEIARAERSLVVRILYRDRVEIYALHGRIALAEAARTGDSRLASVAETMARKLLHQPTPYATLRSVLLSAGAQHQRGNTRDAVSLLRRAVILADAEGISGIAAIARMRLGALIGGDEGHALVVAAKATLDSECIKAPERMAEVYAPGLAPR